jgi:hypothetical protein
MLFSLRGHLPGTELVTKLDNAVYKSGDSTANEPYEKPEEKKAEEKKAAQKKKADLYAEKSKNAAEFFVWFNGLNEKEQAEYEAAFKEVYGGK